MPLRNDARRSGRVEVFQNRMRLHRIEIVIVRQLSRTTLRVRLGDP